MRVASLCFDQFDMSPIDKEGNPFADLAAERANFKPEGSVILFDSKVEGQDHVWVELKRRKLVV